MNREIHVRFWEGLGVRFPRATHFTGISHLSGRLNKFDYSSSYRRNK